ncbi:sigma-70 family RNA polymerase sigma factor [Candidatus Woesebacteria bacterium]|nr:sigma-70 family RNA polymerase sigma factor [Candidatus Woesebacteria bacterium]
MVEDRRVPTDVLEQYLREVRPIELLTEKQEKHLGERVGAGREARRELELATKNGNSRLSHQKFKRLQSIKSDADKAIDELVIHNIRLVIGVARKYQNMGLPLPDLIQEGNIGLIKAASEFDVKREVRFSTWAFWKIRQAVTRALSDKSRVIRIPSGAIERRRELTKVALVLEQELARKPTEEEIAERIRWSVNRVKRNLDIIDEPESLEETFESGLAIESHEFVGDKLISDPEEEAEKALTRKRLDELLDTLPAREEKVLRMLSGFGFEGELNKSEIGRRIGVTRERVRQINKLALTNLRERVKKKG